MNVWRTVSPALLASIVVLWTASAGAHHILGVPHYSYSEEYPQTPVLTYSADLGPNHLRMTGNPGNPEPKEVCSLHVYITDLETQRPFDGTVKLTVFQDSWFGTGETVYGPMTVEIEEAMYKFAPIFPEEANYTVRIEYMDEEVPWIIDLPMVAGEPGSPARTLGIGGAALFAFLIVIRAIHIKRARRQAEETVTESPAAKPAGSAAQ